MSATVRYWAAAKAAAGLAQEQVEVAALEAPTLAALLAHVREAHLPELTRVLDRCSFLVDERAVGARPHDEVALADGGLIDVLPPFAGG